MHLNIPFGLYKIAEREKKNTKYFIGLKVFFLLECAQGLMDVRLLDAFNHIMWMFMLSFSLSFQLENTISLPSKIKINGFFLHKNCN